MYPILALNVDPNWRLVEFSWMVHAIEQLSFALFIEKHLLSWMLIDEMWYQIEASFLKNFYI